MTFIIRCLCFILLVAPPLWAADRDADGVPDAKDACPGTVAMEVAADGCPLSPTAGDRTLVLRFDSGSSLIDPRQLPGMRQWLGRWPEQPLLIRGHTDETGRADANLRLSRARAEAVAGMLTQKFGVAPGRLSIQALGASEPLPHNNQGLAANRRVELVAQPMMLKLIKGD